MSTIAIAPRASVALPRLPAASPLRSPIGHSWVHFTYWPAELLRLVALIYMLPIVIYAVCLPIAGVIKTLLFLAGWASKAL